MAQTKFRYMDELSRMRFHCRAARNVAWLVGTNTPLRRELEIDADLHFLHSRVLTLEIEAL